MKIGILGASGLIGSHVFRYLAQKCDVLGTYCSNATFGLVRFDLGRDSFDLFFDCSYVVIAGAMTRLDACKADPQRAQLVNVERTIAFSSALAERGIVPIFLSSDQVFDGQKGFYSEEDAPNPINLYGELKHRVEQTLEKELDDYLILRLCKTYSRRLEDKGIFAEIIQGIQQGKPVKAAYDLIFNPTDVKLVCRGIEEAIFNHLRGLYHLASPKVQSRYEFTCAVAQANGFDARTVEKISMADLPLKEPRALNTSLKVEKIGQRLPGLFEEAKAALEVERAG